MDYSGLINDILDAIHFCELSQTKSNSFSGNENHLELNHSERSLDGSINGKHKCCIEFNENSNIELSPADPNSNGNNADKCNGSVAKSDKETKPSATTPESSHNSNSLETAAAEHIDVVATELADLFNSLSESEAEKWDKERIKALFGGSLDYEKLMAAPAAIPSTVLPRLERKLHDFSEKYLRGERPEASRIGSIPTELTSGTVLFEGIEELITTKAFVRYLLKNPHVRRPQFLIDSGAFEITTGNSSNKKRHFQVMFD